MTKTTRKKLKNIGLTILKVLVIGMIFGCIFTEGIMFGMRYLVEYHGEIMIISGVICFIIILTCLFYKTDYEEDETEEEE